MRPESDEDGVVLYAAESGKAYGDFMAVVIKDGHVELRYIVGGSEIFLNISFREKLILYFVSIFRTLSNNLAFQKTTSS